MSYICCLISLLVQVTEEIFEKNRKEYIKFTNRIIKHEKDNLEITLKYQQPDK